MPTRPPTFRPPTQESRQEQRRRFDERRGSARERGYTRTWDRAAKEFIAEHPLCLGCRAIGRLAPSVLVDHVIPHRGDAELFWNKDNWQACCDWHHVTIKTRLERLFDQRKVAADQLRLDSATAVELAGGPQNFGSKGAGPLG